MSLESMAVVWAHSEAEGSALLAILAIADHDTDAGAWPAMETIAHRARVTRETARKLIRKLEDMGEIVTERNAGGGLRTQKHMRTNRYEITISCPPTCDGSARHRRLSEEATEARILADVGHPQPVDNTPHAVYNTPPPHGGDPSAVRGAPPPHGGANSSKTTHLGNSESKSKNQSAVDREKDDEVQPVDDWSNWHPGEQVAKAAAVVKSGGNLTNDAAQRFTDAVNAKRRRHAPEPTPPPVVDPAQLALNAEAAKLHCPKGFGTGKFSNHWIPPTMTACASCDAAAAEIVAEANQLEVAS